MEYFIIFPNQGLMPSHLFIDLCDIDPNFTQPQFSSLNLF